MVRVSDDCLGCDGIRDGCLHRAYFQPSGESSLQGIFRATLTGSLMSEKKTVFVTCGLFVMYYDFVGKVHQGRIKQSLFKQYSDNLPHI